MEETKGGGKNPKGGKPKALPVPYKQKVLEILCNKYS
jgi:hypothetical protein